MIPPRPAGREAESHALLREAMRRLEGVGLDPAHDRHGSVQIKQGTVGILQTAIEAVAAERGILAEIRIFPERGWCDLKAFLRHSSDDIPFRAPVNVKISAGKTADNVNARISLLWALHGIYPGNEASAGLLSKNAGFYAVVQGEGAVDAGIADNADYYFAIFLKKQDGITRKGNLFSLKRLTHVQANASNLPFQIHWGKEHATAPSSAPIPPLCPGTRRPGAYSGRWSKAISWPPSAPPATARTASCPTRRHHCARKPPTPQRISSPASADAGAP